MRFLSLFSGIEAASVAWSPLGWTCVAVAEIEPFPCAVLKHRYPKVPNLGDITLITRSQIEALGHIDVIVLGFPCQDVSVAGLRKGFKNADGTLTRSGLFHIALDIIDWSHARWTVGENVPGLFSANEGRDFATVVGELSGAEIDVPGDGWATAGVALGERGLVEWFVLDAQYTRVASHPRAVPQRRRRVFIVRDTGDWQGRPPLFLVRESLCGNPAPRREARQRPAPTLAARTRGGGGLGTDFDLDGGLTAVQCGEIVPQAMSSKWSKGSSGPAGDARTLLGKENSSHAEDQETYVTHSLTGEGFDASEDGSGRGTPVVAVNARQDPIHSTGAPIPLDTDGCSQAIAFRAAGQDVFTPSDVSPPIAATDGGGAVAPTVAFLHVNKGRPAGRQSKHTEMVTIETETIPTLATDGHSQSAIAIQDGRDIAKGQNGLGINDDGSAYTVDTTGEQAVASIQAGALRENPESGPDGISIRTDGAAYTLEARSEVQAVAFAENSRAEIRLCGGDGQVSAQLTTGGGKPGQGQPCIAEVMTLAIRGRDGTPDIETREDGTANAALTPNGGRAGIGVGAICARMAVRRLTPKECARLQGFPDDYLDITIRGKPAADGPKYRALGNSMAVNCMAWIGQRIQAVHDL